MVGDCRRVKVVEGRCNDTLVLGEIGAKEGNETSVLQQGRVAALFHVVSQTCSRSLPN